MSPELKLFHQQRHEKLNISESPIPCILPNYDKDNIEQSISNLHTTIPMTTHSPLSQELTLALVPLSESSNSKHEGYERNMKQFGSTCDSSIGLPSLLSNDNQSMSITTSTNTNIAYKRVTNSGRSFRRLDSDMHLVTMIESEMSELLRVTNLKGNQLNLFDNIESDYLNTNANTFSGRLGEILAFNVLSNYFKSIEDINMQIQSIQWVNQEVESGLPYDLEVEFKSGERKFCEVKSRMVIASSQWYSQWFLTLNELEYAFESNSSYFACCICFLFDKDSKCIVDQRTVLLGLESGIIEALRRKQGLLCLQIDKDILNSSGVSEIDKI